MKTLKIEDACVVCGSCEDICPEVFKLDGGIAVVKTDADLSLDDKIIEAAEACPVEAIVYEK